MNSPRDVDLFLAMWNASINGEDSCLPGTKEWRVGKRRMQSSWLKIWMDCKELCDHIASYENLIASTRPPKEDESQSLMEEQEDEHVAQDHHQ